LLSHSDHEHNPVNNAPAWRGIYYIERFE